ncbi:5,6-dimethylbenzimidazole synthase [Methyloligella halotolerans]|uniref:5,6-dimethylbenzimidazole synthase n=1 Tax=Methyloligella halotolerans TaxID=1177755 RepID=A0A1E2RXR0_9HYPH|nr:5,6-dimethylbenzimidazole synthase [Methyloligella halotolerans]ODA66930.1 5,6-dimethylbenzimidazole synthase [Methyloligella halotolerans]
MAIEPTDREASQPPEFGPAFREQLLDLLTWRRDVRHFKRDKLPDEAVERLIGIASLAPSVGLSEPWRFVLVDDPERRAAVRSCFEACNAEALAAQDPSRADQYARLKLAGLHDAPCQIAVFADRGTDQGHGLGRLTMPETIEYSVAIAIYTLWLAARAEGFGIGWVSILDPDTVHAILEVPEDWHLVGYLCLGYPQNAEETPLLQRQGWESRRDTENVIFRR